MVQTGWCKLNRFYGISFLILSEKEQLRFGWDGSVRFKLVQEDLVICSSSSGEVPNQSNPFIPVIIIDLG